MGDDPIPGLSDLASARPSVAAEWHPGRNGPLAPEHVRAGSLRPVWWLGACGHSWEATVLSRAVLGEGCPICAGRPPLREAHPSLAAEWHPTRNGKTAPDDVTAGSTRPAWWLGKCGHEWRAGVGSRARGAGCPYCSGKRALAGFNDLATTHLDLAAQWHPTGNGDLSPSGVTAGSNKRAWWACGRGHEWEATVASRVRGTGCPYCSGRLAVPGKSDLATLMPALAAEWHPGKNGELGPTDVTAHSNKRVWWLGPCGHEWQARVSERACGAGCPYCSGRRVLPGFNDLASRFPKVASEWDAAGNGGLEPVEVHFRSKTRAKWRCGKCGFTWETAVDKRTRAGSGCPACAGQAVVPGANDLATVRPDLAAQWHPTLNGELKPTDVVAGSGKAVWWLCPKCGASWKSQPCNRSRGKSLLCPECARRKSGSGRARPVRCVETGEVYPCAADAAAAMGLKNSQSISQACRAQGRKAAGFRWEYV